MTQFLMVSLISVCYWIVLLLVSNPVCNLPTQQQSAAPACGNYTAKTEINGLTFKQFQTVQQ